MIGIQLVPTVRISVIPKVIVVHAAQTERVVLLELEAPVQRLRMLLPEITSSTIVHHGNWFKFISSIRILLCSQLHFMSLSLQLLGWRLERG